MMKILASLGAVLSAGVNALPAAGSDAAPCTTGSPVVTAGYTIKYAPVTPTASTTSMGFQPEPTWGKQHVVATYTYGVQQPVESGFAYAQFMCQYTCNGAKPQGNSFYVNYAGGNAPSFCTCYSDLLTPDLFVSSNETTVGAWNSICGVTHPH